MKKLVCLALALCLSQLIIAQDIYTAIGDGDITLVQQILTKSPGLLNAKNAPGQTPLWKAAEQGKLEIARYLIEKGADPATGDNEHTLPLHMAAQSGNIQLFDLLRTQGSDINVRDDGGVTPLFYAVLGRHPDMVGHILKHGGDVKARTSRDWPIMLYGAIFGPLETVQLLIDHKADLHAKNENGFAPIHSASSFGHTEVVKLLVEKGADVNTETNDGVTPIMLSRNPNCYEVVKFLISRGADVNHEGEGGETALMNVAARGTISIAKLLLDHGADINHANAFGHTALTGCAWSDKPDEMSKFLIMRGAKINPDGCTTTTPLHRAARHGQMAMTKNLVGNGAQINRVDQDGFTPLHFAITSRHDEIADYLIEQGAFLNLSDNVLGNTELHMTAMMGCPILTEKLLQTGADISLKNKEGQTAFDLAWYYGHKDVAYLLLAQGADDQQLASYVTAPNLLTESLSSGEATVWFLGHSGWAVKTRNHLLIFDYFINPRMEAPDDSCLASGYILPEELKDMKVTVFSSHSHGDHYSKEFFTWKETIPDIEYVLCFRPADTDEAYTYIPVHDEKTVRDMKISTIRSTDLDGGFLVEVDGLAIFQPGDHANGEDALAKKFTDEIDLIAAKQLPIDILFSPIRGCGLGTPEQVKKGAEYMVEKLEPNLFVPMHAGEFTVEYKKFTDEMDSLNYATKTKWVAAKGDRFSYKAKEMAAN